ncbi:MAG: AAA family ATPase [Actinobacteria bacterium]|nr:AAA family ATPase [Actinomycetota bacterium]
MTRLILVSGKGGVGKSALAASLALAHHRAGARVLAIDVAATGGLAAHLGVASLAFKAQTIKTGLNALAVDRSKALIEYLQVQVGMPGLATLGPAARFFDALASTAPGVREVVTLGKVVWEVKKKQYDVVVADCPPTGQVTGLLRAPETVSSLVPAGRIRQQAEWMSEILRSPKRSELIVVTLAEELPTIETEETMSILDESKLIGSTMIVTNRVLGRLRTEAKGVDEVAEAAALHRSLFHSQQEWLERLPPRKKFPYLFGVFTESEIAARLSDLWGE